MRDIIGAMNNMEFSTEDLTAIDEFAVESDINLLAHK